MHRTNKTATAGPSFSLAFSLGSDERRRIAAKLTAMVGKTFDDKLSESLMDEYLKYMHLKVPPP